MNKNPLQIYILWHENYIEGTTFAEYLFSKFNRNPNNISFHSIGIPTSFKNFSDYEQPINYNIAEKVFIIILVDDFMITDNKWEQYLKDINNYSSKNVNNIFLIPVAISKSSFTNPIGSKNFIRLFDIESSDSAFKDVSNLVNSFEFKKKFLLNEISHEIARELINPDDKSPLKLFLSHAKADGINITKTLKNTIENFTKSKTFFDSNDIQIGYEFWNEIEDNIKNSCLVIIQSDKYSNSSWCRKEVLSAKNHNRPILCINAITKKETRTFPYMANVKNIRLKEDYNFVDIYNIITEIYLEAIRVNYMSLKLSLFIKTEQIKNCEFLTSAPELLNFIHTKKNTFNYLLYPDPPLSEEEIEILNPSTDYITPLTYFIKCKQLLKNIKVGFSISEISPQQKNFKFYMLKDFMNEIVKYVFYYGGSIYYGGDLKYTKSDNLNLLESMILEFESYKKITSDTSPKIFNYVAYPLTENISITDKATYKNIVSFIEKIPVGFKTNLPDDEKANVFQSIEKWSTSLTLMRNDLFSTIDIVIFAGGKTSGYKGLYPGVLEEFLIASKLNKPIYIIGSYGGVTKEIINLIEGKNSDILTEEYQFRENGKIYEDFYNNNVLEKYSDIQSIIKSENYNLLKSNGLTKEENDILFYSENSEEIIYYILKGISNSPNFQNSI